MAVSNAEIGVPWLAGLDFEIETIARIPAARIPAARIPAAIDGMTEANPAGQGANP